MNTTPSASQPAAVSADPKLFLNILRGAALLGLLVIGIWDFGGFGTNDQAFYITAAHHGGNYRLLTLVSFLFEGKATALLAMCFGAGLVLLMQKKSHPVALDGADVYLRQQIWLILFGLVLGLVALWPKDLLYPFGIVGILLFAFWKLPAKALFICSLFCMLAYTGKIFWNYADDKSSYQKFVAVTAVEKKFSDDSSARAKKFLADSSREPGNIKPLIAAKKLADSLAKKRDTLTNKQAEEKAGFEGLAKSLKYDSSKAVAQKKMMRAGYSKLWFSLKGKTQYMESTWLYSLGVWDIASAMFLGMALLGIGFFGGRFSKTNYLLLGIGLLAVATFLAWYRIHHNNLRLPDYAAFVKGHALPYNIFYPLEQLSLATAYAALIMWLLEVKALGWLWQSLAAVGRIAFSNYILQILICAFTFYGYGLGYFGRFKQWELYFIVTELALAQVVFSVLWLRVYKMGPLEWLLYSLVYRKKLPAKIEPASSN